MAAQTFPRPEPGPAHRRHLRRQPDRPQAAQEPHRLQPFQAHRRRAPLCTRARRPQRSHLRVHLHRVHGRRRAHQARPRHQVQLLPCWNGPLLKWQRLCSLRGSVERRRSPRAAFSPACHPLLSPSPLIAFPNRAPAHAPVCARSPKCPVLHAPLPGAALVSDPSSLLRTSRVVSPRPFSPRVLLCRVARTLPALPSKPCPPPAQHSFCRSSTHPVTPLTPTGYGPHSR